MNTWRSIAARVAGILAVTAIALVNTTPAYAAGYEPITGSGSSWSQNALDQWRANVKANYGMTINYNGSGSSAGRQEFINATVDFAVSEIPFQVNPEDGSVPENPGRGYAYAPIVAGGTSFMYHLEIGGKRVTNLRLSGEVITKIFTGSITNWNDPAIQADNPGLAMPDKKITPVVRSDGSGTTAQFTLWMSKQYPSLWSDFSKSMGRGSGFTSQYPLFPGAKGQGYSNGVAAYVANKSGEGSITYVEYSYALKQGFPVVKVLNKSGYYVEPTAQSVAVALLSAQINNDPNSSDYLTQILDGVYNSTDARAYPLSSYSYMIVPTEVKGVFTTAKGNTLGTFMSYFLCEGQQQAASLGYSPLPMNLVLAGFEQIKRIPGAGSANVDPNNCNNPTFKPGDSPSTNQLALTAPQPAACDKQGPDQCTTGTAGALQPTPVSGTGNGGTASNAAASGATGGAASTGAADGSATDGSVPLYDENGNPIEGTASGSGAAAVASPFTVESSGWGWQQSAMLAAVGFFLVAVIAPPALMRMLKKPRARTKGGVR